MQKNQKDSIALKLKKLIFGLFLSKNSSLRFKFYWVLHAAVTLCKKKI